MFGIKKSFMVLVVLIVMIALGFATLPVQADDGGTQTITPAEGQPIVIEQQADYENLLIVTLAVLLVLIVVAGYVFREQSKQLAALVPVEFVKPGLT